VVDFERIRPLLEKRGLSLDPVPPEGRPFDDAGTRARVVEAVWNARMLSHGGDAGGATAAYRTALDADRDNLGALLGLGQLLALTGHPDSLVVLERAVERYPAHPGTVHWYAHAIWSRSWQDAERLLEANMEGSASRLREAIEAGYRAWPHIETDPDLRALRESRRFAEVMREYGR
jgi:hypothetical protein